MSLRRRETADKDVVPGESHGLDIMGEALRLVRFKGVFGAFRVSDMQYQSGDARGFDRKKAIGFVRGLSNFNVQISTPFKSIPSVTGNTAP